MPSSSSNDSKPVNNKRHWLVVPVLLGILSLMTAGYFITFSEVSIADTAHAQPIRVRTHQRTVESVLREAGIQILAADLVSPPLTATLTGANQIQIKRAQLVKLKVDGQPQQLVRTQQVSARDLLRDLGYTLSVGDFVTLNGGFEDKLPFFVGNPTTPVGNIATTELYLRKAIPVSVVETNTAPTLKPTSARTVAEALSQLGYTVYLADKVTPALSSPIKPNLEIRIERAKPVSVVVDGRRIRTRTHSPNVGDVLAEMNIVLYDQDYARPALNTQIIADTEIKVVRVTNAVEVNQEYISFKTEWVPDPALEIDNQVLGQEGTPGVQEKRTLVTYEDGLEVKRELIADFTASNPSPKVYKYGTNIVIRTLDTPQGPIQYWRKIRMLATSYSPSTAGVSRSAAWYGKVRCGFDMRFGIVAVDPRVIPLRTDVYVPDYGAGNACDTGSAILGKRIDLGYDDDNLKLWYRWVDVYLVAPAPPPDNIKYILD